jgi:hypothetical protein
MKVAKWLAVVVLAVLFGGMYTRCASRQWPGDQGTLRRLRERIAAGDSVIDFASITSFRWSRLEVFGPYASQASAERALGFPWPYQWSNVESLDDRTFLVFVDSNRVVAAFDVSYNDAVIEAPGWITPDAAVFVRSGIATLRSIEPVFESDIWPGEGVPIIQAQHDSVVLYATPRGALPSMAVRHTKRGERIRFDSTRFQTIAPTLFDSVPDSIIGRSFGMVRRVRLDDYYGGGRDTAVRKLIFRPYLLQPRAEGECFIRLARQVVAARCPQQAPWPLTQWWAWTPGPGKAGWFIVSDSTAKVVDRRF